jgi:hypothetical protein
MRMGGSTGGRTAVAVRCPFTVSVGALVVGALHPAERHRLTAHLRGCDACTAELVLFAPLPGLLRRAGPTLDPV